MEVWFRWCSFSKQGDFQVPAVNFSRVYGFFAFDGLPSRSLLWSRAWQKAPKRLGQTLEDLFFVCNKSWTVASQELVGSWTNPSENFPQILNRGKKKIQKWNHHLGKYLYVLSLSTNRMRNSWVVPKKKSRYHAWHSREHSMVTMQPCLRIWKRWVRSFHHFFIFSSPPPPASSSSSSSSFIIIIIMFLIHPSHPSHPYLHHLMKWSS